MNSTIHLVKLLQPVFASFAASITVDLAIGHNS